MHACFAIPFAVLALSLAACSGPPELDRAVSEDARSAPYPALVSNAELARVANRTLNGQQPAGDLILREAELSERGAALSAQGGLSQAERDELRARRADLLRARQDLLDDTGQE